MTRNVTDAAVVLGAVTGIDPNDPATAEQAGHALTDYTPFLDAHALEGARIGVLHEGTVFPPGTPTPEIDAIMADVIATLEDAGRDRRRPGRHPSRTVGRCRVPGAAVRVQERHRELPPDVHRRGLPEDARGPDRLQRGEHGPRGTGRQDPLEQRAVRGRRGDRRPRRRLRGTASHRDAGRARGDRRRAGRERPRRDHRADQQRGLAHGSGERRRPVAVRRFVRPLGRLRLSGPHRPGRVRRPPADRRVVHRRPDGTRAQLIGYAYDFEQASQVRVPPSFLPSIDATAPGHGHHGHHATDPADLGRRSVLMPLR